jgi:formamidopyrimidine-DNA glycosylase
MPELPEVEIIKNELLPCVIGQRFTGVAVFDAEMISGLSPDEFRRKLTGKTIDSLDRRGKYLIFNLVGTQALIMHFRMTGALLLNPEKAASFVRAIFHLSDNSRLVFVDARRLGLIWLVEDITSVVGRLGVEPLSDRFTPAVLRWQLRQHHIPVKAALLEQSIIAGIGNMYADEALFAAGIHPLSKTDLLSDKEVRKLYHAIRDVLWFAIGHKGASVDTYVRPSGRLGRAQLDFKVAHRHGGDCLVCGTPVQRIMVWNRGTYFCPRCQTFSPGLFGTGTKRRLF